MRIMFLTNLYPPNAIGGYERLCFDVAEAMIDRDHEIFVLTSSYGGKVAEYRGQHIDRSLFLFATQGDIYIPLSLPDEERLRRVHENLNHFKRAVKKFQPDVLFVWNLFFFDHSLLDVIRDITCKVVYLLTDNWLITFLNPTFMPAFFSKLMAHSPGLVDRTISVVRRLLIRFSRRAHRLDGYAIFPSEFMRNLYMEAGITVENTVIVHHGVNLGLDNKKPREFKYFNDIRSPAKLLFAGRVVEIKGVQTILEALPEIVGEMVPLPVELTILGDAQDDRFLAHLQYRINELGMSSVVRFAPQEKIECLPKMFSEYDIYLFPSLYEPFSLTLIHALASGIPTVASDAGGNREIVFHRDTGLLHAAGDPKGLAKCTLKLLRNPDLCQRISSRGERIGKEHTFQRMVNQIEEFLMPKI